MPHLNHKGPDGLGSKTGRKLGKCKTTEAEQNEQNELGNGQGKRRNSGGGKGQGKRLKYTNKI